LHSFLLDGRITNKALFWSAPHFGLIRYVTRPHLSSVSTLFHRPRRQHGPPFSPLKVWVHLSSSCPRRVMPQCLFTTKVFREVFCFLNTSMAFELAMLTDDQSPFQPCHTSLGEVTLPLRFSSVSLPSEDHYTAPLFFLFPNAADRPSYSLFLCALLALPVPRIPPLPHCLPSAVLLHTSPPLLKPFQAWGFFS